MSNVNGGAPALYRDAVEVDAHHVVVDDVLTYVLAGRCCVEFVKLSHVSLLVGCWLVEASE
jgi:hypothetical protein